MSDTNYWLTDDCARAFWDQHKALPYQELLQDTVRRLDPRAGDRWLDLGCGGGQLSAALWQKSNGQIGRITSADCAAINEEAIGDLSKRLKPALADGQIEFVQCDFSCGLPMFDDNSFDGIVSGLAISYAESRDPNTGEFTDTAYNHLLCELNRILRPGGRLVFSVNVPNPDFWSILWKSLRKGLRVSKPIRVIKNAFKMQKHGRWLRKEAKRGRFHFYPLPEIVTRLNAAGFTSVNCRLSYAQQAYVISVEKQTQPMAMVA